MTRIGIYGGSFSPPHNGHLRAAEAFLEQMWLDFLFVVPAAIPPHKELPDVSAKERLEMTRLAFLGMDGVYVSDMELLRKGPSYTVDTLRELSGDDKRLFLLLGTDMVLTLDEWKEPEEIFKLSYPVYARRESDKILDDKILAKLAFYKEKYGKMVTKLTLDPLEISSSQVRARLERGEPVDDLIPGPVEEYIRAHHLYGT
ncbi:MAG: nicotinate (nicotinamide) nucleotide adenylyltransferase [Clostridia bacterium]|nr:nicotinate (nicotinamide) nucleotide adenylyltransferase [Clostridia bacterium]